jgi:hypothetical protein
LNLEYHRKQAKALLRAFRRKDPDALTRVHETVGERAAMTLTDAQRVIAVEHGQRSWADFKQVIENDRSARAGEGGAARAVQIIETDLRYGPDDPVRVRVVHRDQRTTVTDDAAAITRAGRPLGWRDVARRLSDEIVVNISRDGVVSLSVVRVGPCEEKIVTRIAQASLALYQELLDLDAAAHDDR